LTGTRLLCDYLVSMNFKLSSRAFSLVELMVVISIIGIISAVSINSLSALQKNNRDAQRQADLRLIQGALQQFYANKNYYPDAFNLSIATVIDDCTGAPVTTSPCASSHIYLSKVPIDPVPGTGTPYCYSPYLSSSSSKPACGATPGKCQYYELYAALENSTLPSISCNTTAGYKFLVTPL
jgi:prepilin-type N-terminal cleavage/methylation domain-containing protein